MSDKSSGLKFRCFSCKETHILSREQIDVQQRGKTYMLVGKCKKCGKNVYRVGGRVPKSKSGKSTGAGERDNRRESTKDVQTETGQPVPKERGRERVVNPLLALSMLISDFILGIRRVVVSVFGLIATPFEKVSLHNEKILFEEEKEQFEEYRREVFMSLKKTCQDVETLLQKLELQVLDTKKSVDRFNNSLTMDTLYKRLEEEVRKRNETLVGISEIVSDTMSQIEELADYVSSMATSVGKVVEHLQENVSLDVDRISTLVSDAVIADVPSRTVELFRDEIRAEIRRLGVLGIGATHTGVPRLNKNEEKDNWNEWTRTLRKIKSSDSKEGEKKQSEEGHSEPASQLGSHFVPIIGHDVSAFYIGEIANSSERVVLDLSVPDVQPTQDDFKNLKISGSRIALEGGREFRARIEALIRKSPAVKSVAWNVSHTIVLKMIDERGNAWESRITPLGMFLVKDRSTGQSHIPLTIKTFKAFLRLFEEMGIEPLKEVMEKPLRIGDGKSQRKPKSPHRKSQKKEEHAPATAPVRG